MRRRQTSSRRGAAAVAIVLLLVVVQLTVVATILGGTRDQNIAVLRLDTARAFYAAEGGANMALREALMGVDEDHDGGVGSISDDGNPTDDPQLGTARVVVSRALSGGLTAIRSTGRCGVSRRKAMASVQGVIGGSTQTVMAAFGHAGSTNPRYSTWNGSAWTASVAMPSIGGDAKWVRMKICPTRNETTFISESVAKQVNVCFFNGTTWGPVSLLSSDTGGLNDRPEDIAYEQLSSNAVCAYWKGTVSQFGYRVYDGTTFSAERLIPTPFTTECDFLTLYPRPSSNDILLLAADGIAGGPLKAALWDGTMFGSWFTMVNSLETNNMECYAAAFESQTGRGLAVYAESGVLQPRYRVLTGSSWSSQSSIPALSGVAQWVRLAADPTSNDIMCATLDSTYDVNSIRWDGSSWGPVQLMNTNNTGAFDRRQFDIIYERGTGHALVVYCVSGSPVIRYRTWDGTAWSGQQTGPNLGSAIEIIWLARGFANDEVFIAASDSARQLHMIRWSGGVMSGNAVVEASLSGWPQYYSFAVPEPTVAPHPRIKAWTEQEP